MPLLQLQTATPVADDKQPALLSALSKIVSESIGKPESYVMVSLRSGPLMMGGAAGDAAFADVRSIGGLGGGTNKQIAQKVCALLQDQLGIPANRVFLNFTDVGASHWGWNGGTFG
ncbi:MAG: phenylpyruvate tautomerase MIF-related protein [Candidatus Competibacteraceae bacterium]